MSGYLWEWPLATIGPERPSHMVPSHMVPFHMVPFHMVPFHMVPFHMVRDESFAIGQIAFENRAGADGGCCR